VKPKVLALCIVLAVGLAAAAVAVVLRVRHPSLAAVQTFPETAGHAAGKVSYPRDPPTGGLHNARWLNCGAYLSPVPNENAVHSLEHGVVWIAYRPDLPSEQLRHLTSLIRGRGHLLVAPYPGLRAPVVVTAWARQLRLDDAYDDRLPEFVRVYTRGHQAPEPEGPCTGGTGTPDST
jgi:hypothetical protein